MGQFVVDGLRRYSQDPGFLVVDIEPQIGFIIKRTASDRTQGGVFCGKGDQLLLGRDKTVVTKIAVINQVKFKSAGVGQLLNRRRNHDKCTCFTNPGKNGHRPTLNAARALPRIFALFPIFEFNETGELVLARTAKTESYRCKHVLHGIGHFRQKTFRNLVCNTQGLFAGRSRGQLRHRQQKPFVFQRQEAGRQIIVHVGNNRNDEQTADGCHSCSPGQNLLHHARVFVCAPVEHTVKPAEESSAGL